MGFAHQRNIWYYPTVYALVVHAIGTDIPYGAKAAFIYAACAMSVFNLAITATVTQSLYEQLMSKTKVPSASNLAGAVAKHSRVHAALSTVVGAHKWANRARKNVSEKSGEKTK